MGRKNREKNLSKKEQREETERERVRQKNRKKAAFSVFLALIVLGVIGFLGYILAGNLKDVLFKEQNVEISKPASKYEVEIVNENNEEENVPARTAEYIELLDGDLRDLKLNLVRVVVPEGKMRELYVDIEGVMPYFKVNVDRDSAVTAEDISRMIKYLNDRGLTEELKYIDVRVEGKAFYK